MITTYLHPPFMFRTFVQCSSFCVCVRVFFFNHITHTTLHIRQVPSPLSSPQRRKGNVKALMKTKQSLVPQVTSSRRRPRSLSPCPKLPERDSMMMIRKRELIMTPRDRERRGNSSSCDDEEEEDDDEEKDNHLRVGDAMVI